jgi:hypothetical protein
MMVTIPHVVHKHSIFSTQWIPGSQEVWKRDGFFYHYLICPLARKICQKLSCIREASVTMLRFWGAGSLIQGMLDN